MQGGIGGPRRALASKPLMTAHLDLCCVDIRASLTVPEPLCKLDCVLQVTTSDMVTAALFQPANSA